MKLELTEQDVNNIVVALITMAKLNNVDQDAMIALLSLSQKIQGQTKIVKDKSDTKKT